MWQCWSCSACLRVFVVVVWLVFVGGLGGIATIGAALRRVAGVSGVYGRKTPRAVARKGQGRVPVEGSMVVNLPGGCSKCSRPRWNGGDMGFLGCSGRRFGRAGSWRGVFCGAACRVRRASVRAAGMIEPTVGVFCGAAREGGASWCVLVTYSCAVAWEVLPRMVRFFCGGIGWVSCARVLVCSCARVLVCSCARVLVCSCARWDHRPHCRSGSPDAAFPNRRKYSRRRIHVRRCLLAAAFMRRGVVVVSFVRRPEQAMNISRIE